MKYSTIVATTILAMGFIPETLMITSAQDDTIAAVKQQFVGNYELVSFQSFDSNGAVTDNPYVARIMYDRQGNMAANGMPLDLPDRPAEANGRRQREGFAYFGSFDVNVDEGYVVHRVVGSPMAPQWVGQELVRHYEINSDTLKLSLKNDAGRVTGTLTWRRLD